jgi:hypothetical protein
MPANRASVLLKSIELVVSITAILQDILCLARIKLIFKFSGRISDKNSL